MFQIEPECVPVFRCFDMKFLAEERNSQGKTWLTVSSELVKERLSCKIAINRIEEMISGTQDEPFIFALKVGSDTLLKCKLYRKDDIFFEAILTPEERQLLSVSDQALKIELRNISYGWSVFDELVIGACKTRHGIRNYRLYFYDEFFKQLSSTLEKEWLKQKRKTLKQIRSLITREELEEWRKKQECSQTMAMVNLATRIAVLTEACSKLETGFRRAGKNLTRLDLDKFMQHIMYEVQKLNNYINRNEKQLFPRKKVRAEATINKILEKKEKLAKQES
jgi:hypothetical protein